MALQIPTLAEVRGEICRRSLARFVEETSGFTLEPWQVILCERLQKLRHQTGQRILIHAPAQVGKSQILSKRLPIWLTLNNPYHRTAIACFRKSRAQEFQWACQLACTAEPFIKMFPTLTWARWSMESGAYTAKNMALANAQPNISAFGLDSGFTGTGCELLIIDDPYQSAEDARSEATNRSVRSFWEETAEPRVMANDSNVVVMFHRYHENDIAGYLMSKGDWEVITFPAIADDNPNDPTGRAKGEILSPRCHTIEALLKKQEEDPKTFAGQFQGSPKSDSEGLFQESMFEFVEAWEVPPLQWFYRGWDTAAKAKQSNDPTATVKFGVDFEGSIWITDAFWEWLNWTALCKAFCTITESDGPDTIQAVEDASSGVQLFEEMSNPATRPEMAGYVISAVSHKNKDKRFRAAPIATRAAARPIKVVKFGKHKELVKHFLDFDGLGLSFDHTIDAMSTAWARAFNEQGNQISHGTKASIERQLGVEWDA